MWFSGIEQVLGMGMKESILGKNSCAESPGAWVLAGTLTDKQGKSSICKVQG